MYNSMIMSKNPVANLIANWASQNARSLISRNISHISMSCGLDFDQLCKDPLSAMPQSQNTEEEETHVKLLCEIKFCKDNILEIPGFNILMNCKIYMNLSPLTDRVVVFN